MPNPAKDTVETTTKRAGVASAGERAARNIQIGEARRLFEKQLVHIRLRMPKTDTQLTEVEFEMPVQALMANVLATKLLERDGQPATPELETLRPTPRLRGAIASANKIERGRFANVEEMFDALAKEARGQG